MKKPLNLILLSKNSFGELLILLAHDSHELASNVNSFEITSNPTHKVTSLSVSGQNGRVVNSLLRSRRAPVQVLRLTTFWGG